MNTSSPPLMPPDDGPNPPRAPDRLVQIATAIAATLLGSIIPSFVGLSFGESGLGFLAEHFMDAIKLIVVGSIIEMGRRFVYWASQRVGYSYTIRATFLETDPAYHWMHTFLEEQKIWTQSMQFYISGTADDIKQGALLSEGKKAHGAPSNDNDDTEYLPMYQSPHLFRWNSYWIEVTETMRTNFHDHDIYAGNGFNRLDFKIFTRNASVLPALIAHAHHLYKLRASSHIVVHTLSSSGADYLRSSSQWPAGKYKVKRPLNSVMLPEGVMDKLVGDAKEFLNTSDWYKSVGIPYRRGFLLYGPPGTGKTSTIHALAGELNLEIYSLSLSSSSMNDDSLHSAVSSIPKRAILLIEDIDCAFSNRSSSNNRTLDLPPPTGFGPMACAAAEKKGSVTLSGLLNVLDGIGSDEGRIFFATTNHIELIDPALIRPGRVDVKVLYHLASNAQSRDLFLKFYPEKKSGNLSSDDKLGSHTKGEQFAPAADTTPVYVADSKSPSSRSGTSQEILDMATRFASYIPDDTFSIAELQGFLLGYKHDAIGACRDIEKWVEAEQEKKRDSEAVDVQKPNDLSEAVEAESHEE